MIETAAPDALPDVAPARGWADEWQAALATQPAHRVARLEAVSEAFGRSLLGLAGRLPMIDLLRLQRFAGELGAPGRMGAAHLVLTLGDWLNKKSPEVVHTITELEQAGRLREPFALAMERFLTEQAFRASQERSDIRELHLAELFPEAEDVAVPLGAVNPETGHENQVDLPTVVAMAGAVGAKQIFEFSNSLSRTAYHFAGLGDDVTVFALTRPPEPDEDADAPAPSTPFAGSRRGERIYPIYTDGVTFETDLLRGRMDFVFVDADPSYERCRADSARAFELLKPGGTIVWHDYAAKSPGVWRWAEQQSAKTPLFRIARTCLLVYREGVDVAAFEASPLRASLAQQVEREGRRAA